MAIGRPKDYLSHNYIAGFSFERSRTSAQLEGSFSGISTMKGELIHLHVTGLPATVATPTAPAISPRPSSVWIAIEYDGIMNVLREGVQMLY